MYLSVSCRHHFVCEIKIYTHESDYGFEKNLVTTTEYRTKILVFLASESEQNLHSTDWIATQSVSPFNKLFLAQFLPGTDANCLKYSRG